MQAVLVGHGSALYVGPTSDKSLLWVPPASQSLAQAPLAWPSSLEHCPRWRSCSVYNHTVIPKSGKEELWPLEKTFPMFCSIRWHSKDPRDQGKEIRTKGDDGPLEEHRLDTCACLPRLLVLPLQGLTTAKQAALDPKSSSKVGPATRAGRAQANVCRDLGWHWVGRRAHRGGHAQVMA